jgi:hypothetical protein
MSDLHENDTAVWKAKIDASLQRMTDTSDRIIAVAQAIRAHLDGKCLWSGDQCPNHATSTSRP